MIIQVSTVFGPKFYILKDQKPWAYSASGQENGNSKKSYDAICAPSTGTAANEEIRFSRQFIQPLKNWRRIPTDEIHTNYICLDLGLFS